MYEQNETMAYSPEMDDAQATEEASLADAPSSAEDSPEGIPEPVEALGEEVSECGGDRGAVAETVGADEVDPTAPAQSSDPAPQASGADQTADSELECIRRELSLLRAQLEGQAQAMQKIGLEYAEFCDLYPNQSPEEIPDEVWDSVRQGVPLSAAFALSQRRRHRILEKAKLLNEENKRRSSGSVEGTTCGYFSPDEVRAMSQSEVRANYQKILLSMQKWQ